MWESHICSTRDNLVEETRYLEWKNTQALEKRDNFQMPKLKEAKKKLKKINEQLALAQKEKYVNSFVQEEFI